jgi:hypothetical protein
MSGIDPKALLCSAAAPKLERASMAPGRRKFVREVIKTVGWESDFACEGVSNPTELTLLSTR